MKNGVNARAGGKMEFVSNISNLFFHEIRPIKSACKFLISSLKYELLTIGM
jgi:hypothetical protein